MKDEVTLVHRADGDGSQNDLGSMNLRIITQATAPSSDHSKSPNSGSSKIVTFGGGPDDFNLGALIHTIATVFALASYSVGLFQFWFSNHNQFSETFVSLYDVTSIHRNFGTRQEPHDCVFVRREFTAIRTVAFVTMSVAACSILTAIVTRMWIKRFEHYAFDMSVFSCTAGALTLVLSEHIFRRDQCGESSFRSRAFARGGGQTLFFLGLVLSVIGTAAMWKDLRIPRDIPRHDINRIVSKILTTLLIISAVLLVAANDMPFFFKMDLETDVFSVVTFWKFEQFFKGENIVSIDLSGTSCPRFAAGAIVAEIFSFISCACAMIASFMGYMTLSQRVAKRTASAGALIAFLATLAAMLPMLILYSKKLCNDKTYRDRSFLFGNGLVFCGAAMFLQGVVVATSLGIYFGRLSKKSARND